MNGPRRRPLRGVYGRLVSEASRLDSAGGGGLGAGGAARGRGCHSGAGISAGAGRTQAPRATAGGCPARQGRGCLAYQKDPYPQCRGCPLPAPGDVVAQRRAGRHLADGGARAADSCRARHRPAVSDVFGCPGLRGRHAGLGAGGHPRRRERGSDRRGRPGAQPQRGACRGRAWGRVHRTAAAWPSRWPGAAGDQLRKVRPGLRRQLRARPRPGGAAGLRAHDAPAAACQQGAVAGVGERCHGADGVRRR